MLERLRGYVFILLLIFLPTQLGRHFWPEWSYVSGVRVDYLSPIVYLTDVLVLALFVLEIPRIKIMKLGGLGWLGFLGGILLVVANVYFSLSPAVSTYKWLKVAEFGFLAWFVARNRLLVYRSTRLLLIPIFYESVLAIWQFWRQGSVGGFWYFLGERTFNLGTPGIAQANIGGQLWLRPYGTLPHPNVLAGFLIVGGALVVGYLPRISRKIAAGVLVVGVVALVLTMSRAGIVGLMREESESWAGRWQLAQVALEEWRQSPILGTGLGTSPMYGSFRFQVSGFRNYALAFQPTHSIFLLALAETGLLGVLGVFGVLGVAIRSRSIPLVAILVLGLFDHYFLTLQQGQLILALVLGLAFASMKGK